MQLIGIVGGGFRPRRSRQNAARGFGDLTPSIPKIGQGSVEDSIEKNGWERDRS